MSPAASYLILFSSLVMLLSTARAQNRAPHGIAYENPMAFSPSAYEFFHPKTQEPGTQNSCTSVSSSCSPLPVAAEIAATKTLESEASGTPQRGRNRKGGAAIAGIMFGLAFVVLLTMGAFYVLITRRANVKRAQPLQPNV